MLEQNTNMYKLKGKLSANCNQITFENEIFCPVILSLQQNALGTSLSIRNKSINSGRMGPSYTVLVPTYLYVHSKCVVERNPIHT